MHSSCPHPLTPVLSGLLLFSLNTLAAEYDGPEGWLSKAANAKLWNTYCEGSASDPSSIPAPDYSNALVVSAGKKLSQVGSMEDSDPSYYFYFYSGPLKKYGLGSSNSSLKAPPAVAKKKGINSYAHAYLTQVCGEYRDRATLVEAKIRWADRTVILPTTAQADMAVKTGKKDNIWDGLSAHSYQTYLEISEGLHKGKKKLLKEKIKLGQYSVDQPVPGQTVCEAKFIIKEYIGEGFEWDSIESFNEYYPAFEEEYCTQDDLDYYFDFRGDSNFKHYSPESNGMIWYSNSIAGACKSTTEAEDGHAEIFGYDGDEVCSYYYEHPFYSRWNAARAGMAAWLFRSKEYDKLFSKEGQQIFIRPHFEFDSSPFGFSTSLKGDVITEWMPSWNKGLSRFWANPSLGFNILAGNSDDSDYDAGFAYERLRDAVNRHTDWYHSGYNDGMGLERSQAYSPFVASSYEMSASDGFTAPGATVNAPSDGRKHWMFVFKVHKDNWFTSQSVADGVKVDFDRHWFDETSLGTNGLAKSERAWDRLGTALEGELDSILCLQNIKESGAVAKK